VVNLSPDSSPLAGRSPPTPVPPVDTYLQESIVKSRYRRAHSYPADVGGTWAVRRAHSLHTLVPRLGGFPPGLGRWAIESYSHPGDTVLDPFCGKGTGPLEALLAGRRAVGNDAAADAFIITHAKLSGVSHARAAAFLERLRLGHPPDIASVPEKVRIFFHDETLRQILSLRSALFQTLAIDPGQMESLSDKTLSDEQNEAIYVFACLLGCLHGPVDYNRNRDGQPQNANSVSHYLSVHCNHTYSASPDYVRRYCGEHGLTPPLRDVIASVLRKSILAQVDGLPEQPGCAVCGPAESLTWDSPVDLVVTSPPYFRAQSYAWDNWLRLWCLGYEDYRQVEKKLLFTDSIPRYYAGILRSLSRIKALLGNRAVRVVVVVGDVAMHSKGTRERQPFLNEEQRMERYISRDESKGLMINTSEIVGDIGRELSFDVELIVNDFIPRSDRALASVLTKRQGADIDRIIVLRNRMS
jgi:DNA methylase